MDDHRGAEDRPRPVGASEACGGRRGAAGVDGHRAARGRPAGRGHQACAAAGPGSSRPERHQEVDPAAGPRNRPAVCRGGAGQGPAAGAGNRRAVCPVEGAGSRPETGSGRRFDPPADPGHRDAYQPRHRPGRPRSATAALRHAACRHAGRSRKALPDRRTRVRGSVVTHRNYSVTAISDGARFTPPRSCGVASEFSDHAFPGRMTAPGGSNYMCGRLPRRTR